MRAGAARPPPRTSAASSAPELGPLSILRGVRAAHRAVTARTRLFYSDRPARSALRVRHGGDDCAARKSLAVRRSDGSPIFFSRPAPKRLAVRRSDETCLQLWGDDGAARKSLCSRVVSARSPARRRRSAHQERFLAPFFLAPFFAARFLAGAFLAGAFLAAAFLAAAFLAGEGFGRAARPVRRSAD